uniref:AIP/AIPL N-terminal FKBP-type PPIase domain-containing protein n=1 Tax=Anser brachyrhynchus TaxID=132585 RepID=A0A8B9CTH9_9AVES
MEETYLLNVEGVKKKILHGGQGELPKFQDGSKITFHFQTLKDNFERTVIDDSREAGIPMEIIVGKMFKMEIWETLLSSMRAGEVAEFWCDAIHTGMYALVSKGMRRIAEGRDPLEGQKHRCGMGNMFDYHSTGYDDLDELQRTPQPLIFIMELFRVEEPSAYKRDTWAMSKEEKLAAVPVLHSEGNRLVLRKEFRQAAAKYQEAVICLRNLQAKEKPWEDGWLKLESLVTPLVLNYCQCQLELGEYYEVLEHTTELLQKHKDNAKAYFKRAKAHAAVWNEREAREDFLRVADLDPAMAAAVKKELKQLGERMRKKHVEDRKRYQGVPSLMPPPPPPAHPAATRTARTATHTPAQGAGTQHPWRSVIWAPLPWWQTYPWSQRAASAPASPKSSPAHPAQPTALSLQLGCGAATHRHAAFPAPCRAQRHGHLLPPPPQSSSGATPALLVPRGTHST